MDNYWQHRDEINRLFNAPKYRVLKYSALAVIGIVIATQIALIIWMDQIPFHTMQIIRGCIGLGAIIFVILVTILAYKVYAEYFRSK